MKNMKTNKCCGECVDSCVVESALTDAVLDEINLVSFNPYLKAKDSLFNVKIGYRNSSPDGYLQKLLSSFSEAFPSNYHTVYYSDGTHKTYSPKDIR